MLFDQSTMENNCKKSLNQFVNDFVEYSTELQKDISQLSKSVNRIETLSPKFLVVEKVK